MATVKRVKMQTHKIETPKDFFYYYWKLILIGLAALAVLLYLVLTAVIGQPDFGMAICVRSSAPDSRAVTKVLKSYAPDRNGDGHVKIDLKVVSGAEESLSESALKALRDDTVCAYLLDGKTLEELTALGEDGIPEGFVDPFSITPSCRFLGENGQYALIGSSLEKAMGLSGEAFPDGLYLVLRGPLTRYKLEVDDYMPTAEYETAKAMMKNVLTDHPA